MENENDKNKYANMMPDYSDPDNEYIDELDLRIGFARRAGAFLIDIITVSIINIGAYYLLVNMGYVDPINENIYDLSWFNEQSAVLETFLEQFTAVTVFTSLIYYLPEIFYGASLGKIILEIKITDQNRQPGTTQQLLTRYVVKHINTVSSALVLLTGIAFINLIGGIAALVVFIGFFFALSPKKQALHDIIAKTAVYYKDELDINYEKY